jgi:hypothetical protein
LPGYLQTKCDNHRKYGHMKMAEDIAAYLTSTDKSLEIEGPIEWQGGRYIAIFVTLVPGYVRMIIQLTDSGLHQHVYNLKPMSNSKADLEAFCDWMARHHPERPLPNGGRHAKLPAWENQKYPNSDLSGILDQIRHAQAWCTT